MKKYFPWIIGFVVLYFIANRQTGGADIYGAGANARALLPSSLDMFAGNGGATGDVKSATALQAEITKRQASVQAALDRTLAGVTGGADRGPLNTEISFLTTTLQNIKNATLAGAV